jgi:hypothetical protein
VFQLHGPGAASGSSTFRARPARHRKRHGRFVGKPAQGTLTSAGVADNIISLLTGHKSRELRRYQHLREDLKRGTVDLIAKTLEEAQKNGKDRNDASSAPLLHTHSKNGKKGNGENSK